jgi:hypothetical protein
MGLVYGGSLDGALYAKSQLTKRNDKRTVEGSCDELDL